MFVDLLWVEENRRGHGLGTSLLQSMERVAGERDCRDMMLETLSGAAARLYEAAGYRLVAEHPTTFPGSPSVCFKSLA